VHTFYLTFGVYMGLAVMSYVMLLILSYYGDRQYRKGAVTRKLWAATHDLPAVTIVAPAKNEEPIIAPSVAALLRIPYPNLSLVVVDDGSTDQTFSILQNTYKLFEVERPSVDQFSHQPILSVWHSASDSRLTVVKKVASKSSKGDANNAGLEVVTAPFVLVTDIDSVIEPDTIHKLVARQAETNADAVGCSLRPLNGCSIGQQGVRVALPKNYWAFSQVCEYIRTFQLRQGWATMGSLNIISGAGGFFKIETLRTIGGYRTDTPSEDLASTWGIYLHGLKTAYEPSTNIYTQVPDTWKSMASQRKRWARGLMQILLVLSPLLFKGTRQSLMMLWLWLFELVEPIIEVTGLGVIAYKAATHSMSPTSWLWLALGISMCPLLTFFCAIQMERLYGRMSKASVAKLLLFSFVEIFPVKLPLSLYWRLAGTVSYLTGNTTWEPLPRQTFSEDKSCVTS